MGNKIKNIIFNFFIFVIFILTFILFLIFYNLLIGYKHNIISNKFLDTDKDGIINWLDDDIDGDGIENLKDEDADGDKIRNIEDILKNVKKYRFRFYDQLGGEYNNIGYLLGGMVCIDLILFAFEKTGIYLDREIVKLYYKNKKLFKDISWNNPNDKNFTRRVRNYLVYFKYNKMILNKNEKLQPGDLIIFSDKHIAMIEKVEKDDYIIIELAASRFFVRRTNHKEIFIRNLFKYGDEVIYVRVFR